MHMDDIDNVCRDILRSSGKNILSETTAIISLAYIIFNEISFHEELDEIAYESDVEPLEFVRDRVVDLIKSDIFAKDTITIHRTLSVNCAPEDVVTSGTAGQIGINWTTDDDLEDKTFLDQFGVDDGREVVLVAEVTHDDVDWFSTFWKRIDPATSVYDEIVLCNHAVPKIISVTDPHEEHTPGNP